MATQTRYPTGDAATNNNFTALGGGSKYVEVDEVTADDDTTYVYRTGSAARQMFTYSYFSISSSAIAKVSQFTRCKAAAAPGTNVSIEHQVVIEGTLYSNGTATSIINNNTWTDTTKDLLNNPATSAAWVEADLESAGGTASLDQFGIITSSHGASDTLYMTQTYIVVDYTESAAGPTNVKTWLGLAQASVKTVNGLAIASVKSGLGLT